MRVSEEFVSISQFWPTRSMAERSPELRLLWAVLETTTREYLGIKPEKARDWLWSDARHFLSFRFIAEVFDVDPYAFRRRLLALRHRRQKLNLEPHRCRKQRILAAPYYEG